MWLPENQVLRQQPDPAAYGASMVGLALGTLGVIGVFTVAV